MTWAIRCDTCGAVEPSPTATRQAPPGWHLCGDGTHTCPACPLTCGHEWREPLDRFDPKKPARRSAKMRPKGPQKELVQ